MRRLCLFLVVLAFCISNADAQVELNSSEGTVRIGPNGIDIRGRGGNRGESVRIFNNGTIDVRKNKGGQNKRVIINPGTSSTTKRRTYNSSRGASTSASVKAKRIKAGRKSKRSSSVRRKKTGTPPPTLTMTAKVGKIEQEVYGKKFDALPLARRVIKLESENLGKAGSGSLKARIEILARELGVNFGTTAQKTVTSKSTVSRRTASPSAARAASGDSLTGGGSVSATVAGSSQGAKVVISGVNEDRTIRCNGHRVVVTGTNCDIKCVGFCTAVVVSGTSNTVWVDVVDQVVATGTNNTVHWKRSRNSGTPKIVNTGINNDVMRSN